MILHNDFLYHIYFGDCKNCCVKSDKKQSIDTLEKIKKQLKLKQIIILNQTHSCNGFYITKENAFSDISLFEQSGDYITTTTPQVGIGVITADCLPVIFYDPVNNVVSIAHAGWRGAVTEICKKIILEMQTKFNTKEQNIITYFAPCAKFCCYQITKEFFCNLENSIFIDQVILTRQNKFYFNLPKFVELQLLDLGIQKNNIRKTYNDCTICNTKFCSFRRQNKTQSRQVTVVALK